MSELQRKLQMSGLPPRPMGGPGGLGGAARGAAAKRGYGRKRDYTPVTWDNYYEEKRDIKIDDDNVFRVYERGSEGPVCFFLHGGGFSALSWAVLSKILTNLVHCRCAAVDMRGHGDSQTTDDVDLSAERLSEDVGNVVKAMYGDDPPPIILVGHSMGGAIAVHTAKKELIPSLIGLAVIDVVEGTAMDALTSMQSFLRGRPKSFKSLEASIEWCVRTGQIRNIESAKVSMVGQLKKENSEVTANAEITNNTYVQEPQPTTTQDAIAEEDEDEGEDGGPSQRKLQTSQFRQPVKISGDEYTWRIDLSKTEPYWRSWFQGLSNLFLSCEVPKMLLLAGVDRLDKELTVGQMQGKFQMAVLPQCGHAVHEDVPDRVAEVLATFMVRHKVAASKDNFQMTFPAC